MTPRRIAQEPILAHSDVVGEHHNTHLYVSVMVTWH